jgi:D-glycero-D-manno-heptose 1,7-bisphosphate phosphatase
MGECKITQAAIFLDRDGVINEAIIRDNCAYSPRTREEFVLCPNVGIAISRFKNAGFKVIVFTNQPDIARGLLQQSDLEWMHERIKNVAMVDDIVYCPHDDQDHCDCRKPKPGMIVQSARKWGINIRNSYVIGDSAKDICAAENCGCTGILIRRTYNINVPCSLAASCLMDAADTIFLCERNRNGTIS